MKTTLVLVGTFLFLLWLTGCGDRADTFSFSDPDHVFVCPNECICTMRDDRRTLTRISCKKETAAPFVPTLADIKDEDVPQGEITTGGVLPYPCREADMWPGDEGMPRFICVDNTWRQLRKRECTQVSENDVDCTQEAPHLKAIINELHSLKTLLQERLPAREAR